MFWPGALLGELLDIPVVEVLPLPIMTHKEYEMSFPNPLAYAPQMGLGYTVQMVLTNSSTLLSIIAYICACICACIYGWLATGIHTGDSYHASQVHADWSRLCLQSCAYDKHKPKPTALSCCCRTSGSVYEITSSGSFYSRCNDQLWLTWRHSPERQDNVCASMMRGCPRLLLL